MGFWPFRICLGYLHNLKDLEKKLSQKSLIGPSLAILQDRPSWDDKGGPLSAQLKRWWNSGVLPPQGSVLKFKPKKSIHNTLRGRRSPEKGKNFYVRNPLILSCDVLAKC